MAEIAWGLVKASRPKQWIKNFALFAGLVFSGQLNNPSAFWLITQAFFIFSGLTAATYFLNDLFDIDRDKKHPFKRLRPIASGVVPSWVALTLALGAIVVLLPLAYHLSPPFFYASVAYLILQLFYSAYLKSIILLDVIVIATGFVLRVYGGIWAVDAHLSVWFLLSVISFALFLAIGKRRSERTLMEKGAEAHRETLLHYPQTLLDTLTTMFATSAWLTYALFAFQQPLISINPQVLDLLSDSSLSFNLPFGELGEAKYMMITVPVVIYGVMRYLYAIYEKREGESPEKVLLTDTPLLTSVVLWLVMVIFINYYLGG